MEIDSGLVGTRLKEYETVVSWRHTMNYAAALDDNNPLYFDDEREGGIMAPPMFCVALSWPILENIFDYLEVKDLPREIVSTQVHYRENLFIHRLVRPGDKIRINGSIAAILPHRSGTELVIRFDATDAGSHPVFTEHSGGLLRGVQCDDQGRGGDSIPKVASCQGDNDPLWERSIPIDFLAPFRYDGCTNIFFPIHTSVKFAHTVGLPGIILQGTATLGYAVREIIDREALGDPARLKILDCRFSGMVFPGTNIRVQLLGREMTENGLDLFFIVLNAEGKKAITDGYARLEYKP